MNITHDEPITLFSRIPFMYFADNGTEKTIRRATDVGDTPGEEDRPLNHHVAKDGGVCCRVADAALR